MIVASQAQTARVLYDALARGDRATLDQVLTEAFVGHTAPGMPLGLGGVYHGRAAMIDDFWWRLGRSFAVRAEPDTFALLDDGRLQVAGTYRGRSRATQRRFEAAFIHVLGFDGEQISSLDQLTDTAAWHAAHQGAQARVPDHFGPAVTELETIEYQVRDQVAEVRLNRPQRRNAIDLRMGEETLTVAREIAADSAVRAVLIAGNGPALTVGGDIDYFATAEPGSFGALASRLTEPFHEAFRILARIDAPIVTAAHGSVAGGGLGYVYAADITLAAEGTVFATAFSGLGVSGDGGGTWHLPRLVGAARAKRMYLEGLRIDAATAAEWGLIAEVVPAGELQERALTLARRLAAGPTRAYGLQRQLLRDTWHTTLSEQLRAETAGIAVSGATSDAWEAIGAFRDKRRPTFEGR